MVYGEASPRVVGAAVSDSLHARQYSVFRAVFRGACAHAVMSHKPFPHGYARGRGTACREWFRGPVCVIEGPRPITTSKSGFALVECS